MAKQSTQIEKDEYSNQEIFADEHLNCTLCGQELEFEHTVNFQEQTIRELARCGQCHVRRPMKEYPLH